MGTQHSSIRWRTPRLLLINHAALIEEMSATRDSAAGAYRGQRMKLRQFKVWLIAVSLAFIALLMFALSRVYREIGQRRITEKSCVKARYKMEATVLNLS